MIPMDSIVIAQKSHAAITQLVLITDTMTRTIVNVSAKILQDIIAKMNLAIQIPVFMVVTAILTLMGAQHVCV